MFYRIFKSCNLLILYPVRKEEIQGYTDFIPLQSIPIYLNLIKTSRYMASKLVCSVPTSTLPKGHADQFVEQYKERCKIKQPHIIYSIACESQTIKKKTTSGDIELFQIYLFFEYNQLTLQELMTKRRKISALIPEEEVWCLIKGVISAMLFLQQNNISHGMICLDTIYFDEEYLLYRVYDQELISGKWQNYLKCQKFYQRKDSSINRQEYEEIITTLAPEVYQLLSQDQTQLESRFNPFKADVYSFGQTMIQFLTLNQGFTTFQSYEWFKMFYSNKLVSLLKYCRQENHQYRPDWVGLQEFLNEIPKDKHVQTSSQYSDQQNLKSNFSTLQSLDKQSQNINSFQTLKQLKQSNDIFMRKQSLDYNPQYSQSQSPIDLTDDNIDQKLLQLNLKIQEKLVKSFSKTKTFR